MNIQQSYLALLKTSPELRHSEFCQGRSKGYGERGGVAFPGRGVDRKMVGFPTLLRMISGARYSGVPHRVQVRPFTRFAKPKSVIWTGKRYSSTWTL